MAIKHKAVKTSQEKGLASEWNDDHEITGNVDFDQYQAENMIIHAGLAFPAGPAEGQLFYRTDLNLLYYYDGSNWINFGQKNINICKLYRATAVTIADITPTTLTWDAESFDGNTMHSLVTNPERVTAKEAGYYLINLIISWGGAGTGTIFAEVYQNGVGNAQAREWHNFTPVRSTNVLSTMVYLNANDYIYINVYQNTGGNLDVEGTGAPYYSQVSVFKLTS